MQRLDDVALGVAPPDDINILVLAPTGGEPYGARLDEASGFFAVTRLSDSLMRLPGNLGVVPGTAGDKGEPLTALLHTSHALAPGMIVAARPVGVLYVGDEGGDEVTILAVPATRLTRRYEGVANYADLPAPELRQIAHFFCHYRDLEERRSQRSAGWGDVNEARRTVMEAAARARGG